jgi:hypothetical protein
LAASIRLYLDEHIPLAIAAQLRRRDIEVVTLQDIGALGDSDENHLQRATAMGCVLCTCDEDCWREMVTYCIERSMSYIVMFAIGEYLADCAELEPLPLIDLTPDNSRKTIEGEVTLTEDVTRIFQLHAKTAKPEPDRELAFKGEHRWARYKPRLKDDHPAPEAVDTTSKSIHWLF